MYLEYLRITYCYFLLDFEIKIRYLLLYNLHGAEADGESLAVPATLTSDTRDVWQLILFYLTWPRKLSFFGTWISRNSERRRSIFFLPAFSLKLLVSLPDLDSSAPAIIVVIQTTKYWTWNFEGILGYKLTARQDIYFLTVNFLF